MKILNNSEFCKALSLSKVGKVGALDIGVKCVGLAISDESRYYCSPVGTITRKIRYGKDAGLEMNTKLFRLMQTESIPTLSGMVIGLPLLQGKQTSFCDEILHLISNMNEINLTSNNGSGVIADICTFWDESFSTTNAKSIISQFSNKRSVRLKEKDSIAASLILESFLEHPTVVRYNIRDNSLYYRTHDTRKF